MDIKSGRVAGHYTLAAAGVPLTDLAPELTKRLPRYPSVPVARVGRLAVDLAFRNKKLGGALLADAAVRAMRPEVAVLALVADAKDDAAVVFDRHHGFESFGGQAKQLVVSLDHFARESP